MLWRRTLIHEVLHNVLSCTYISPSHKNLITDYGDKFDGEISLCYLTRVVNNRQAKIAYSQIDFHYPTKMLHNLQNIGDLDVGRIYQYHYVQSILMEVKTIKLY